MESNRSLIAGGPGAPTVADVHDAADELSRRMRSAGRAARDLLPSVAPPKGGVNSSPRGAGAPAAAGLEQVPSSSLLSLKQFALVSSLTRWRYVPFRMLHATLTVQNNVALPVWADEQSSDPVSDSDSDAE